MIKLILSKGCVLAQPGYNLPFRSSFLNPLHMQCSSLLVVLKVLSNFKLKFALEANSSVLQNLELRSEGLHLKPWV